MSQAQQGTLNVKDALSYLDQVKVQFAEQPDVYNRFLDIMKDFKSQSIDTPGVIERVSTLFRGHPTLIQGFNTFLPPGYKIECSMDPSEANLITVTTPSGTTTQREGAKGIAGAVRQGAAQAASTAAGSSSGPRRTSQPPGYSASGPASGSGPPSRLPAGAMAGAPPAARPGRAQSPHGPVGIPAPAPATPGAAAGAGVLSQSVMGGPPGLPGGPLSHPSQQIPPAQQPMMGNGPDSAHGKSPMEFNHAINFVNKIKQRYSNEPETYKQFLEILQTYQREGKPIQEVYAQVTKLFEGAGDLLEEFKQFLPDTSAQNAHPVPGPSSGQGMYALGQATAPGAAVLGRPPPTHAGLPLDPSGRKPSGQGAPGAPAPARSKKRSAQQEASKAPPGAPSGQPGQTGRSKKAKHAHKGQGPMDRSPPPPMPQMVPVDPGYGPPPGHIQQMGAVYAPDGSVVGIDPAAASAIAASAGGLIPSSMASAGIPLGPAYAPVATLDEVTFFDRVKKHIDDRAAYLEFLKLLNLYTQDIVDVRTLVDKAAAFIGGHRDLFATFKSLCGYEMGRHGWLEDEEAVIENTPALERPRIDLTTCELQGASYRRLPKEEVNLTCSGRDQMCWEVLNDDWVSHPTWGSEGEGFNPHKKNVYEDALYRSEEERHEYDYHIEANLRTIALLEPIAARIAAMDEQERAMFRLKPGLGGQSRSIYHRVLRKIYGREAAVEIVTALHDTPSTAIPVVLSRLRQKDEEWKRAQREWNKVWRVVDERNWWKALDHRGVTWKASDKKAITTRGLIGEIELRRAEDVGRRWIKDLGAPRSLLGTESGLNVKTAGVAVNKEDIGSHRGPWHLEYDFSDKSLVFDVIKLALSHLDRGPSYSRSDIDRIEVFIRSFLPLLMGQDAKEWEEQMGLEPVTGDDEDEEEGSTAGDKAEKTRKSDNLRMKVLRGQVGSSTAAAAADGEIKENQSVSTTLPTMEQTWIQADLQNAYDSTKDSPRADSAASASSKAASNGHPASSSTAMPTTLNFFCSTSHYIFLRLFQLAYARLGKMKRLAAELGRELDEKNQRRKARGQKAGIIRGNGAALRLGLQDRYGGVGGIVGSASASVEAQENSNASSVSGDAVGNNAAGANGQPQIPSAPLSGWELHPSRYYSVLLELIEKLFDGDSIDQNMFEESVRFMYGIEGYVIFTIDKVLGGLVKITQSIINDSKCTELQALLQKDRTEVATRQQQKQQQQASGSSSSIAEQRTAQATEYRHQIAMRMSAECLVGKEEHLFRVGWSPSSSRMGIQMLSRDDPSADLPPYIGVGLNEGEEEKLKEERWLYYLSSYALWAPTEGLMGEAKGPFLKRSVAGVDTSKLGPGSLSPPFESSAEKVDAATFTAANGADASVAASESTTKPSSQSWEVKYITAAGLEIKVCLSTYRLFFVADTSDVFARQKIWSDRDVNQAAKEALKGVVKRKKRNVEKKKKFEAWWEAHNAEVEGKAAAGGSGEAETEGAEAVDEPLPAGETITAPTDATVAAGGEAMEVDEQPTAAEATVPGPAETASAPTTDAPMAAADDAAATEGALSSTVEKSAEPLAATATQASAVPKPTESTPPAASALSGEPKVEVTISTGSDEATVTDGTAASGAQQPDQQQQLKVETDVAETAPVDVETGATTAPDVTSTVHKSEEGATAAAAAATEDSTTTGKVDAEADTEAATAAPTS